MPTKYTEAEKAFFENADIVEQLCAAVASGSTLPEFCELHKVRYGIVAPWVYQDDQRRKAYGASTLARGEWFEQVVYKELRGIAQLDIRGALNNDGTVKAVSEWPDELARALSGFDISEAVGKDGDTTTNKKLKLLDKLKALELIMKNRKMLSDRIEVSGKLSLEQLVEQSREESPS